MPLVHNTSSEFQEANPKVESTQHSHNGVSSELGMSHKILVAMTKRFTSELSIDDNKYLGTGDVPKWNTPPSESKKTEKNYEKEDHDEKQDSSKEQGLYFEERASHTLLASHDDTPVFCLAVPDLNAENEESQYQDNKPFETLHTENAKPQNSECVPSGTSNQQSATHAGPITQEAAPSPSSNPLWNGDSKLNMAPPQCSDGEMHSAQEWEELGKYSDANLNTINFISTC